METTQRKLSIRERALAAYEDEQARVAEAEKARQGSDAIELTRLLKKFLQDDTIEPKFSLRSTQRYVDRVVAEVEGLSFWLSSWSRYEVALLVKCAKCDGLAELNFSSLAQLGAQLTDPGEVLCNDKVHDEDAYAPRDKRLTPLEELGAALVKYINSESMPF